MLNEFAAGVALAATVLSPAPAVSTSGMSPAGDPAATEIITTTIPLVREELGAWYTLSVAQACPDSHPYVHEYEWVGTLPAGVTFASHLGGVQGTPAVMLTGLMTNWNFSPQYVSLDLTCTSDPDLGVTVHIGS